MVTAVEPEWSQIHTMRALVYKGNGVKVTEVP